MMKRHLPKLVPWDLNLEAIPPPPISVDRLLDITVMISSIQRWFVD